MTSPVTFVDLEFDTTEDRGAPLGDIAASLVSLHDLLRDLGTMAAYPSSVEFRDIQVVAIEMHRPLTIKLSLLAISAEAVRAFQEICRDIILFRERRSQAGVSADQRDDIDAQRRANIRIVLGRVLNAEGEGRITESEMQRVCGHIVTLQNAEVSLKRVVVKADAGSPSTHPRQTDR